jgi:hypothetical protein
VVQVLYTWNIEEAAKPFYLVCEEPVEPASKAIVLLKFDASSDSWKYVTEDDANADDEFCTDKVGDALK